MTSLYSAQEICDIQWVLILFLFYKMGNLVYISIQGANVLVYFLCVTCYIGKCG